MAALACFAAYYIPALCLGMVNAETVVLPVFYHDIVAAHHTAANWQWGGFSAVFPDVITFFALQSIYPNGLVALQAYMVLLFLALIGATAALCVSLDRPHKLSLFALLLLLWVALVTNFGLPFELGVRLQNPLLQPVYHSGTGLLFVICFALLIRQLFHGLGAGFWGLLILAFLGGVSDILFLVDFSLPALGTLALLALAFPSGWRTYLALGINLTVAGIAGYFLAPYCFPAQLSTASYNHFSLDGALGALGIIGEELKDPHGHMFILLFTLDVFTILGGLVGLVCFCFPKLRARISSRAFTVVAFCSLTVLLDWAAAIFTGDYQGNDDNRYTVVALVLPLFLIVFGLHAVILWRPWLETVFVAVTCGLTVITALFPPDPSGEYQDAMANIPYLRQVMKDHHIKDGLADYWLSNLITSLSDETIPLRSVAGDGTIFHWFNNIEWFGKGRAVRDWPDFRLIYSPNEQDRINFGSPDEIIHPADREEIWIYSEARSIRYSVAFDILSNKLLDQGRTEVISAADLPSAVGSLEKTSRIAVAGRDPDGYLTFGPYLTLIPAHYRVTFRYAYLAPPDPDKIPTYDSLIHTESNEKDIDYVPLPYVNNAEQVLTRDLLVTGPDHQYEMRIHYHASGTLRVDSLSITYLGP